MATIALTRPIVSDHARSSSPRPPLTTSPRSLESINTSTTTTTTSSSSSAPCPIPIPIPNKHIPVCPPGPAPAEKPDTPPQSPPSKDIVLEQRSLLYPPDSYGRVVLGAATVYEIDAAGVAAALDHLASQPLPAPAQVFPWFHGLHPANHVQQAFFIARRRTLRKTPRCWRGITIVKAGGDLTRARLKGAIAADEFLLQQAGRAEFREIDPKEGFSVRNFHIQAAKTAMVSDIIVYGDDQHELETLKLARDIATAQLSWRASHERQGHEIPLFHTFVCKSPFREFERHHPEIVATDAQGQVTGHVLDFFRQERLEMCTMTQASEIDHNVWLGPTPDPAVNPGARGENQNESEEAPFDIHIECSDLGRMNPLALQTIAERSARGEASSAFPEYLEFPSSGSIMPPTWSHTEADGILESCKWIYNLAHGIFPPSESSTTTTTTTTTSTGATEDEVDCEGDSPMSFSSPRPASTFPPQKILIHCTDGYTESTLLALAYYTYATGLPVPKAWLNLHVEKKRNFFAYPSDVALLTCIAPRLLSESPVHQNKSLSEITELVKEEPGWLRNMDGSLPSRVTSYMYLGNLGHANNPGLLREMGIGQILSVGETANWRDGELEKWGKDNIMVVQRVQDNGVDPLTEEFERCLEFIDRGRRNGTATLVHCRVGVSRSATICIAETMRSLGLSFPRAYCFVRARRLNVIIQPHLRFSYELLKWEEHLATERAADKKFKRELEWPDIAREIAAMNKPYAR